MGVEKLGLKNVRIIRNDAVDILTDCVPNESLAAIHVYFPDPWHKKRHHKRRLIQPPFVELLTSRLKPGGLLHLATDWENYAEQMMEVLTDSACLANTESAGCFAPRPEHRPLTKFERRGHRLGHGVWDLLFEKVDQSSV